MQKGILTMVVLDHYTFLCWHPAIFCTISASKCTKFSWNTFEKLKIFPDLGRDLLLRSDVGSQSHTSWDLLNLNNQKQCVGAAEILQCNSAACTFGFTLHISESNLLLFCCTWSEKRMWVLYLRVADFHMINYLILTVLCPSCMYVQCLELMDHLHWGRIVKSIWITKLGGEQKSL